MKQFLTFALLGIAISVFAINFSVGDPVHPATITITPSGQELRISCRFKPHREFAKNVNADFNDSEARDFCQQGLLRYWEIPQGTQVSISGLYVIEAAKKNGNEIEYTFGIPDVKPVVVAQSSSQTDASSAADTSASPISILPKAKVEIPAMTSGISQSAAALISTSDPKAETPKKPQVPSIEMSKPSTAHPSESPKKKKEEKTSVSHALSYETLTIYSYQEENGTVSINETQEYTPSQFISQKEFDQFCQSQFQRIGQMSEQNFNRLLKTVDIHFSK